LVRFGQRSAEWPGLLDDAGILRDLTPLIDDIGGDALLLYCLNS